MKVKPQMIQDDFMYDNYLGCPVCREAIIFPLIRNPVHIYDKRPTHCKKCGAEFDWSEEKVNHPAHYNIPGRKECIEEMLEMFGTEKVQAFCELNAYKYRYRHDLKNGQEDLDKAKWYEEKKSELECSDGRSLIANYYGLTAQENQLIEEMAELTQAICKMNRINGIGQQVAGYASNYFENLIEELADVKLILDEVIFLLGSDEQVNKIVNEKIERTIKRIGEE